MGQVYVISDPHFGHENEAKRRGFSCAEEQDELIMSNWNKIVNKRDLVFILGDIAMENKKFYYYLDYLKGSKSVVLGNHDLRKHVRELLKYVDNVSGAMSYNGFWLTHIPIHEIEIRHHIANIHGHVHEQTIPNPRYFNACVDVNEYKPIPFDNIKKYYEEVRNDELFRLIKNAKNNEYE